MREQRVVVAIVKDDLDQFLVTVNENWGGYAFPMVAVPEDGEPLGSLAIQAVENDLVCTLPDAAASALEFMSIHGISYRTGEETLYHYWLYLVDPKQPLGPLAALARAAHPPLFLTYDELINRHDLTRSTPAIAQEFVKNQEVVLSVITRAGANEPEFLLVWNDNYRGYFFPAQRMKSDVSCEQVGRYTVRHDLGYRGQPEVAFRGTISDIHASNRFNEMRSYEFHVCDVQLPEVDLHQPDSLFEESLARCGRQFLWLPGSRLNDPTIRFSPTMAAVRSQVLEWIPRRTLPNPLRRSEGGVALIERTVSGKREWLVQWNDRCQAFFFVGGHRNEGETFRECVVREIEKKLGLTPAECGVENHPAHHFQYPAISSSTRELTDYTMELFNTHPDLRITERIASNPHNKWLDETEIRRLEAYDGRPVSVSVRLLLRLAKVIV